MSEPRYLSRIIALDNGVTIACVGLQGDLAWAALSQDLPLTSLHMEAVESGSHLNHYQQLS